jgi:hypothetical protein
MFSNCGSMGFLVSAANKQLLARHTIFEIRMLIEDFVSVALEPTLILHEWAIGREGLRDRFRYDSCPIDARQRKVFRRFRNALHGFPPFVLGVETTQHVFVGNRGALTGGLGHGHPLGVANFSGGPEA